MLTGLTRPKQMLYFFQQNQEEIYSTNYISQYICNNFDLSKKKIPKSGIPMIQQVNNEVSSNFTKFADPKYKKNPIVNFKVISTDKEFLYQYQHNPKLKLPTPTEIDVPNKYMTTKLLKPSQTNFNFEQIDEEAPQHLQTTIEEQNMNENSPLFEDIIAADKINKEEDIVSTILENYQKMNIYNLEEITFITTRCKKKVTINISNI
jgi:hypothetical protein